MKTVGWLQTLAVTALVVVACSSQPGQGTASGTRATPTTGTRLRGSCPTVQPAPPFQPSAPSNRNLALVRLRGSAEIVVRDITDINHPTTISTLGTVSLPQFVSATDLSYVGPYSVIRAPIAGSPTTPAANSCSDVKAFAWSPDGTSLAYVTNNATASEADLHLVTGGQDRVVTGAVRAIPPSSCESQTCADLADARLLYSPSGAFISYVEYVAYPAFRVWTSDGRLITSLDLGSTNSASMPTMSVWSGDTLYFRDAVGVERWRDGTQSLVLSGVPWIRPKASPAGGQIVYEQRQLGEPDVLMLDVASGSVRLLAKLRSEPAFLTSRYIWYQGERPCAAGDAYPCGLGGITTIASSKTYIYDLQDGTETESIITNEWDAWPHPA